MRIWLLLPAGPLTDIAGLEDLGIFTKQANALASSGLPGTQKNLTLDMSGNAFSGTWPQWLFHAVIRAPAKVNLDLTVGDSLSDKHSLRCPILSHRHTY